MLAIAAVALNRSGADIAFERLFFDAAAMRFPRRDDPLLVTVLHDAAKWLSTGAAIAIVAAFALSWRTRALSSYRNALGYLALAALSSALAVSILKYLSGHSCPWDLAMFGGSFDFYPLFGARPPNAGPGRCLPSGHASVGCMWIAVAFAWRRLPASSAIRKHALAIGTAVAVFALATSAAQLVRGAHFLSHLVLTAVTCWAIAYAADRLMPVAS